MIIFELGREKELSAAEIITVLAIPSVAAEIRDGFLFLASLPTTAADVMARLGGTISIAESVDISLDPESIADYMVEKEPAGKVVFSYRADRAFGLAIKKAVKAHGRSARFIEIKNSASVIHNNLVDGGFDWRVIDSKLFRTVAIQPIEEFTERDYGRPGSDSKSGMLPPKLARMLLNLSGASLEDGLWDPFCGSGTILMEAAAMGYRVLCGSDISAKAVKDTKENVDWVKKEYPAPSLQLFTSDIRNIRPAQIENLKKNKVRIVVTEPFLGKPLRGNETQQQLFAQARELRELYVDAFRVFGRVLPPKSTIVFIIPRFKSGDTWIPVDAKAAIEKIGCTLQPFLLPGGKLLDHLLYHRSSQHLAREVWRFTTH